MTWHPVWVIAVKKSHKKDNVFFVSGIDTNVGKSYATGWLSAKWNADGVRTITQKFVQTGNIGISEDIELHRKIMGWPLLPEDLDGTTMPEIFSYPCSPHLAAEIDGRPLDFNKIESAISVLSSRYDAVLLEGAGGLMVPLTRSLLTIDYVKSKGWPLILVTSGRLGSISHTLLSLESIHLRGIRLSALVYNNYPHSDDATIENDTRDYLRTALARFFPQADFIEIPLLNL
ncbi:MAG: dethiobiotin synthase [Candidatus Cryptobacteroides sp.]